MDSGKLNVRLAKTGKGFTEPNIIDWQVDANI